MIGASARRSAKNTAKVRSPSATPEIRSESDGTVVRLIWWPPITDDPEQLVRLLGETDVQTLAAMYRAGLCRLFADELVRRVSPARVYGARVQRPRVEVDPLGLVRLVESDRTRLLGSSEARRLALMCRVGGHDDLADELETAADAASQKAKEYDW